MRREIVITVLALSIACSTESPESNANGTWVGTITTEGNVTTVVNESGSVWGGTATLVEEASIGVDAGEDDPYMLGRVRGVAASDEHIYLIDSQVAVLRVYDWNGNHLHDLGREGDGPGEYRYPTGVGVDGTGRVWLHDRISTRLVVYSPGGETAATLSLGGPRISGEVSSLTVTADGQAYVFDIVRPDESAAGQSTARLVMRPYDINGVAGKPITIPRSENPAYLVATVNDVTRFTTVPFYAGRVTAFAPTRAVVTGVGEAYRFEIRHPDGNRTLVERSWEPPVVVPEEATAHEQAVLRYMRDLDPDWAWDGPAIPTTKSAYFKFVPTASGEIWVVRSGPATFDPDCEEDSFELDGEAHCWPEQRVIDAFDVEGRYLGEVSVPSNLSLEPLPFINSKDVIARFEDEAGTIMVKRYRLVLPGEARKPTW